MALVPDPIPIGEDVPNNKFHYQNQLARLFQVLSAITLTQDQKRAIADGDKAGNLDARYIVRTSSATPDAENVWTHNLKRIPRGYIIASQDKAASLYVSTTAWTSTTVYLKSNIASVAWVVILF